MLVIVTDRQVICPEKICVGCLWATSGGEPRWQKEQLYCGHQIRSRTDGNHPAIYECQMGFELVDIRD